MDFNEVPQGFAMALMRNEDAVNAYSMMTKAQKKDILQKARMVGSRREMNQLMEEIAETASF